MKNTFLYLIALLSVLVLIQVSYYLYSFAQNPHIARVYLTQSEKSFPEPPKCFIHEPIYTNSELKKIFTPKSYSSCKTTTKDIVEFSSFDLHVKCELNKPEFFADPGIPQELGGSEEVPVSWSKSYSLKSNSEFLFVNCGKKSVYAFVFNRFNQEVSDRANRIRKELNGTKTNFNVFFLVFDSLSRFVSYNFLPKFTEYMRKTLKLPGSEYSVYEFTKIGLPEEYTLPNMAPMLYGESWTFLKNQFPDSKPDYSNKNKYLDFQRQMSIWNYYSRLGYTTLFLYDTSWDFLSRFVGKTVLADHVFQNFWKHAWSVYGWHDFSSSQRCMGRENAHNVSFTYVYDYFNNYKDNNKFAYVHLSPTHESSGNVKTLDTELKNFVQSILKLMQDRGEDLVFYILSDHGWKYPNLILDLRYHAETLSPMTYLIQDKRTEKFLNNKEILEHNSQQLLGRYDFNLALKYLAQFPYGFPASKKSDIDKKQYLHNDVQNLMIEKINENRTCTDIGVNKHRCVCSWFEEFDIKSWHEQLVLEKSFQLILEYLEMREKRDSCARVKELELAKGKKLNIQPDNKGLITFYELFYTINTHIEMMAKITYAEPENLKKPYHVNKSKYKPVLNYKKGGTPIMLQLTEIKLDLGCGDQSCLCHIHPNILS